jgi:hypothetical protein
MCERPAGSFGRSPATACFSFPAALSARNLSKREREHWAAGPFVRCVSLLAGPNGKLTLDAGMLLWWTRDWRVS